MTNTTMTPAPRPTYGRRAEFTRTDFVMPEKPADRSKNGKRSARKNRKTRTIL